MRRVAVTAVGVVSPIGRGFAAFSKNLLTGQKGSRRLTEVFGRTFADVPVRHACVIDVERQELPKVDSDGAKLHRSVRFAVDALAQIMEATRGHDLGAAGLHCGVGVGQLIPGLDDFREHGAELVLAEIEAQLGYGRRSTAAMRSSAMRADYATAYLQRTFGLGGVSGTYNGACSAATQACIAACEEVLAGATYALGGGHDSLITAGGLHLMHELGTLTEEPEICPFDVNRDGTMIGEGAVYLLFEELAHARARGAPILAEVIGWASSIDGYHLTSPDPSGDPAVRMIQRALQHAQVPPDRIDYVNAHGTSTIINDMVEASIIKRALEGHRAFVSSTKAQVGHLIAGCGTIGLAACLAALERQVVPPNPNLREPDPDCDVELAPPSALEASLQHVLCNSFGFGGQNSCVVLRRDGADAGAP